MTVFTIIFYIIVFAVFGLFVMRPLHKRAKNIDTNYKPEPLKHEEWGSYNTLTDSTLAARRGSDDYLNN